MLSKKTRAIRDVILQKLPHDYDDHHVTWREHMSMILTRYLASGRAGQDMFKETLLDIISHLQDGFPFRKRPSKSERADDGLHTYWNKKRDREDMAVCKYERKRVLRDLELYNLIQCSRFGRLSFAPLNEFIRLKEHIDMFDNLIDENLDGYLARLYMEDNLDEEIVKLFEQVGEERILIKKLYRAGMPYQLLKYLLEHEHEKGIFEFEEIYTALGATKKSQRKLKDWVNDLKIDEGMRRGRYIELHDNKLQFRSSRVKEYLREKAK